jgi:hypothetical protein
MRKALVLPLLIAVISLSGYGFSKFLNSQDTSLGGYLSGLMLNFWGGEEHQLIRVNLHNHSIALYQNGALYKLARINSTGNPNDSTATPTGKFRILSKDKWHISGSVIMPLSLRFFQGYYFHDIPQTRVGTYIDTEYSHGCIRLAHELAQELFNWANVGAYVEIYDSSLARADNGSDEVYYLPKDGTRRHITSETAFIAHGYRWEDIAVIPAEELAGLQSGLDIF